MIAAPSGFEGTRSDCPFMPLRRYLAHKLLGS